MARRHTLNSIGGYSGGSFGLERQFQASRHRTRCTRAEGRKIALGEDLGCRCAHGARPPQSDSKSRALYGRVGSTPSSGTNLLSKFIDSDDLETVRRGPVPSI